MHHGSNGSGNVDEIGNVSSVLLSRDYSSSGIAKAASQILPRRITFPFKGFDILSSCINLTNEQGNQLAPFTFAKTVA